MENKLLKQMIDEGYVNKNKHKKENLFVYNYTKKTQYDSIWNEVTIAHRGLITDEKGNVLARPFSKFFNLEELEGKKIDAPKESFEVYEKLDGSLGILYWIEDKPFIATRGSFDSDQAIHGTKILHKKYSHLFNKLDKTKTYLFEIIYPKNRIVIDYGKYDDLVLLSIRETKTGEDLPLEDIGFPLVKKYDGENDFNKLKKLNKDNEEGFVIKFESGMRVKIKFEEYVRLHRILTNISNKSIWELLSKGEGLGELIEKVPDEFFDWVMKTKNELVESYDKIESQCKKEFKSEKEFESRKEFAEYVKKQKYPVILFKINDGKDYSEYLWKLIRPEYSPPFRDEGAPANRNSYYA